MAINAQDLLNSLNSTEFSQLEQLLLIGFEAVYDKEIYNRFKGTEVKLNKDTYFTKVLRDNNINSYRDSFIFNNLVATYDIAGWVLSSIVEPQGSVIRFTVK